MKKVLLTMTTILFALPTFAANNILNVNCTSPKGKAGGSSFEISGVFEIGVSETTGQLKLKKGSKLSIRKSLRERGKLIVEKNDIVVSGTYYPRSEILANPNPKSYIEANEESTAESTESNLDNRTYSEIIIRQPSQKSSIFEIKGSKLHPLSCEIKVAK